MMSQEFVSSAVLSDHAVSDAVVVNMAADLSWNEVRFSVEQWRSNISHQRDVSNTLEFASRNAYALTPEGQSWSWFHNFTSAIKKLGWTAQTVGRKNVNLGQTPGTSATANLIIKIANGMGVAIDIDNTLSVPSQRQLIRDPELFGGSSASAGGWSFAVTDVSLQNDALIMQMVAVEFQYSESLGFRGQFSSSHSVRVEKVYFTANQSFLDAHREGVVRRLEEFVEEPAHDTPLG
ncbi:hypothetical protein BD779DRAFT_1563351 [Infundibulicybe gibba]|nr:hypothetical protein BD779DRAFT_1563351 [Infundibulicybe gibba]